MVTSSLFGGSAHPAAVAGHRLEVAESRALSREAEHTLEKVKQEHCALLFLAGQPLLFATVETVTLGGGAQAYSGHPAEVQVQCTGRAAVGMGNPHKFSFPYLKLHLCLLKAAVENTAYLMLV